MAEKDRRSVPTSWTPGNPIRFYSLLWEGQVFIRLGAGLSSSTKSGCHFMRLCYDILRLT